MELHFSQPVCCRGGVNPLPALSPLNVIYFFSDWWNAHLPLRFLLSVCLSCLNGISRYPEAVVPPVRVVVSVLTVSVLAVIESARACASRVTVFGGHQLVTPLPQSDVRVQQMTSALPPRVPTAGLPCRSLLSSAGRHPALTVLAHQSCVLQGCSRVLQVCSRDGEGE